MKALLSKEFRLASHPTMFFFPLFAFMLFIPNYPYYVAFMYTCLEIFFLFLAGRENKDQLYTLTLPVTKGQLVNARCLLVVMIQLFQILFSIPFALLAAGVRPAENPTNLAGIEANVAFFGLIFLMYALFNGIFLPLYYKTGYTVGKAFVWAGSAVLVYILLAEGVVLSAPFWAPGVAAWLEATDLAGNLAQLPLLAAGMAVYGVVTWLSCRKCRNLFGKVDV